MTMDTAIPIRGGQFTTDIRLDRVRDVDLGNLNYLVRSVLMSEERRVPRSYTWRVESWLDQLSEGSCVGHGCAHELLARPAVVKGIDHDFARNRIYHPAQHDDPWTGCFLGRACPIDPSDEQYEGTSTTSGLNILRKLGYVDEFRWALTIQEASTYLGYRGPLVIGVDWYSGMFNPDADGFIHASGNIAGGHCVCVIAIKIEWINGRGPHSWDNVDFLRSYWVIHNSWGKGWGVNGRAKIALIDVMKLWPGGDFACITGRRVAPRGEHLA